MVIVADTGNSTMNGLYSTDRIRVYVNGQQVSISGGSDPGVGGGTIMNTAVEHTIGGYTLNKANGYMANLQFIDGQALGPTDFAESVGGVWIPKQYTRDYGTNGFHLDFAPENMEYSGDTITRVLDESPNSNHWTAH